MNYSLNEVTLIPAKLTNINSRNDIYPFYKGEFGYDTLPIFVSPMTCILNGDNICKFTNKVLPILPVSNQSFNNRIHFFKDNTDNHWVGWTAVTLKEFKDLFIDKHIEKCNLRMFPEHILIDVANGHMRKVYEYAAIAKETYPELKIMIGNIANPETYEECCKYGIDYVRIGIGGGSGCKTSCITGMHTSLPYLITKINNINCSHYTKIVADGGVNTIDKAIKCLALGADYVMMGKCFAQCKEACGEARTWHDIGVKPTNILNQRHYYGQASEQGQLDRFGEIKSYPEGTDCWINIEYTLEQFVHNFESSLRSAMSYANAETLKEFIGNVDYEYQSINEFNLFNK